MTVGEALAAARATGVARLDAQLLLARRLKRTRAWLLAHDGDALDGDDVVVGYRDDLAQRAAGVPLAYIVGAKEFHGLTLHVTPAVLVPRPETELLVDWAVELLCGDAAAIVDLGTGSGAVALAVKHHCPAASVTATDASGDALAVAAGNARQLGLEIEWLHGDWWQPLGGRTFAMALSNPPYVAAGDRHLRALAHEPQPALVSGADGLDALRAIVAGAAAHVQPGGWLLLEHGHDQADAVGALLAATGFVAAVTRADLAGVPRCTGARRRH